MNDVANADVKAPRISKDLVIQTVGWIGAITMLLAFFLTSFSGYPADGMLAILLNMGAGATIALASWTRRAYQSVFVNTIWFFIGLATLLKGVIG